MLKYKSGKCKAVDLNHKIVKNSGGGFFLSFELKTNLKVGDKFKKDSVIAYHKDFFTNDAYNNCRLNVGTLAKVALMSTYNTYQDATVITHKLSEDASTEMCFNKQVSIGKNANVEYMVKKGQYVTVGDSLITFDTSYEDNSLNQLLASLSNDQKENILADSKNDVKSKYSGVVEEIKMYSTVDLDELSPSLRKIFSSYYHKINSKKAFLEKYDPASKDSIMKCGMLVTDTTKKIEPNMYGTIKGNHVEDGVLIEIYIKHSEPLEVGSKIANYSALKNTVGEIIPKGYEPYSEYRPDEEISTIIASNSILKRMTPSITLNALGNKCIIELKRYLENIYKDNKPLASRRSAMQKVIYDFFTAFDPSGKNTKKYKDMFDPMTDRAFDTFFKGFFEDEKAYLILEVCDYEHNMTYEDIEEAARVINCPLFEYVYMPHLTMDKKHVICTKEPVPVGYICIKRTQQTVAKKNGLSTNIDQRSALTAQVVGADKNGRESDLENTMLISMGLDATVKELNSARADDMVMKQEMLKDISLNGFVHLDDLTDDVENKTTLNTVDTYFIGMGIKTDLVSKGLMTKKELKNQL